MPQSRKHDIPHAAPDSPLGAFARVLDLADAVRGLRIAAESETHDLYKNGGLPKDAVSFLVAAHQDLLEAHRVIQDWLTRGPT